MCTDVTQFWLCDKPILDINDLMLKNKSYQGRNFYSIFHISFANNTVSGIKRVVMCLISLYFKIAMPYKWLLNKGK